MTAQGSSRILVTGGTGRLGRLEVARLRDDRCKVGILSRRARQESDGAEYVTGDLAKNTGMRARGRAGDRAAVLASTPAGRSASAGWSSQLRGSSAARSTSTTCRPACPGRASVARLWPGCYRTATVAVRICLAL